jgi:hypothetical protein
LLHILFFELGLRKFIYVPPFANLIKPTQKGFRGVALSPSVGGKARARRTECNYERKIFSVFNK